MFVFSERQAAPDALDNSVDVSAPMPYIAKRLIPVKVPRSACPKMSALLFLQRGFLRLTRSTCLRLLTCMVPGTHANHRLIELIESARRPGKAELQK